MLIAIGSTNEAKVHGVREILAASQLFSKAETVPLSTSSGVSDQPLSLQETIQGAKNRAKSAFDLCVGCDYSFGIESGLMEASGVSTGYLNVSICSIYDGENYYTGLSTGFEIPPQILEHVLIKKMDLSQACLHSGISNNEKIGSTEGLIGILTGGKVDRKEYSKQCISAAILQLENAEWYTQKKQISSHGNSGDEYTPKYCSQLEAAYGEGLMSDGGSEGIDHMFDQIPLDGKRALDIGSGMGGVPFYLAEKHGMQITGLEVNSWLVEESKRRIPKHLQNQVDFLLSVNTANWPIEANTYDIIYSKGVIVHLEDKNDLFQECRRLLKEEGLFVITDWLSSEEKKWGDHVAKLVELEKLALFPESESGYIELLTKNGFSLLSVRDDSEVSAKYNQEIVERLKNFSQEQTSSLIFNDKELEDSILGYESIVQALKTKELRALRFVVKKS